MKVVVVGLATHQTSVPVGPFPVRPVAVRCRPGQIQAHVGGPGFNVARMLSVLGDDVLLVAPMGEDAAAATIDAQAFRYGVSTALCSRSLSRSPRSVILLGEDGQRAVFTDLGEALTVRLDLADLAEPVGSADAVVLSGLELARPVLDLARGQGRPVAVDLQDVHGPDDPVVEGFLGADILTMSNENVRGHEGELVRTLRDRSRAGVVVVTLAADGALVVAAGATEPVHVPATAIGKPPDTTGSGDSFLATLVHELVDGGADPVAAVRAACADAAWALTHPAEYGAHDSHP